MSSDDVVIINDDNQKDSDIEVVDISRETRPEQKSTQANKAIIIDDDVIEIIDVDAKRNNKDIKDYLTKVCSENKLIGEFIEKCLDLENSDGMLRVIYRTFLPLYFKMEDGYRESNEFKKVVNMTLRALDVNPHLKFSHLKFVCDMMKSKSRDRKKVELTTLSTKVAAKSTTPRKPKKRRKRRSKLTSVKKSKKRKVENVIELDESLDGDNNYDEPAVLDLASDDVVILEDDNETSNTSNKENRTVEQSNKSSVQHSIDVNRVNDIQSQWTPVSETPCLNDTGNQQKKERIHQIEKQIESYKYLIDKLEQEEVTNDTVNSPYIQCERFKAHIVQLYKELCSLTGDEPIKKREIHFTATDGRPQLPLKILETFINNNIGPDGIPCMPDFLDVMDCVCQANYSDDLGWDKPRIWLETRALFTFCGQAMQDSRKKREWRYMLGIANSRLDDDPAERDPQLMARLEANRRIAVKKELDLLEQYVKIEEGRHDGASIPNDVHVSQDHSDDETEENTFAASTSNRNNGSQVIASTVTNNIYSCRTEDSLNSENNIFGTTIYRAYEQRFINSQVQEITVEPSQDTRMLEISIGSNQNPEIRVGTENNVNYIENQKTGASLLEVCVEKDKPPEVKVINISGNYRNVEENLELNSITDTSTCIIDFNNSIFEKNMETFEDTYKDFVKSRAEEKFGNNNINNNSIVTSKNKNRKGRPCVIKDVYSIGSNQKDSCNRKNTENIPLVIKDVYSVATKIDTQNNCAKNRNAFNLIESGNKLPLFNEVSMRTNHNYSINGSENSEHGHNHNKSRTDTTVASDKMSILIKDVYSVATTQNNTSILVNSSELDNHHVIEQESPLGITATELNSGKANANNETDTVQLLQQQNMVTKDLEENDVTANIINTELPNSNLEEENTVKVKTEIHDTEQERPLVGITTTEVSSGEANAKNRNVNMEQQNMVTQNSKEITKENDVTANINTKVPNLEEENPVKVKTEIHDTEQERPLVGITTTEVSSGKANAKNGNTKNSKEVTNENDVTANINTEMPNLEEENSVKVKTEIHDTDQERPLIGITTVVSSGKAKANNGNVNMEQQNMVTKNSKEVTKENNVTANINTEMPNLEEENPVKVKTETSDLLKEMESFGNSFTATVFDIEDPFLIIEISDSSDESEDDLER